MIMKTILNKTYLSHVTAVIVLVLCAGCQSAKEDKEGEKAVIKVGRQAVTLTAYNSALKRYMPEDTAGISPAELKALKSDFVNQLIEEELILGEARRMNIDATAEEVAAESDRIKAASGDDAFKEAVTGKYGGMENWNEDIRRKVVVRKTISKVIGARVAVQGVADEKAALEYYRGHPGEYTAAEQVRARMIVVANIEDARKVRKGLTPLTFAQTAKEVSISPERESGGDLGFFGRGDMPEEFEKVVFRLRLGEISDVVKTEYGYHIFLLEARKKGGKLKFDEVKERIMERLREDQSEKEMASWVESLKKGVKIELQEGLL